jgi:RNA polymerase sigma-70 factor (ECF subfamily)
MDCGRSCSDNIEDAATIYTAGVVTHLRLVPQIARQMTSDEACVDAFQRELDYVFRTLRRLGTSPSEMEDLAQEVFLALRRSWCEYDPRRPLRPYLFGIAFRLASAHYRKQRREVAFGIVELPDSRPAPDEALQHRQLQAMMLAALEKIPLPRRAVLVMRDLDDVPVAEVASVLGVPRFTAYSRLRKARGELEAAVRRMLKEVDGR